ncbi:MAG: hypothetical protein LBH06_04210 [Rikenellaceae bacterium]|jgi:hypothetical protein|nr:hypothetical protein [Rikenellaceae bacterium]
MRRFIVSAHVLDKLSELASYLKDELKISEEAAFAYQARFSGFIRSLSAEVDYPLCRFKRWWALGWRCAVFEKQWIIAYEVTHEGVIVREISNAAMLTE